MFSAPFCYQNVGAYFWCSSIKPYYLINVKHFSGLFKSFLKFFKLYFLSPWTRLFGPLIDRSQAVRYKWCLHIKLHFKKKVNSFLQVFAKFFILFFDLLYIVVFISFKHNFRLLNSLDALFEVVFEFFQLKRGFCLFFHFLFLYIIYLCRARYQLFINILTLFNLFFNFFLCNWLYLR